MALRRYTNTEIMQRGEALYAHAIRSKVEDKHRGEFLVLDIETGNYEIATDELVALDRLQCRSPDAVLYVLRIGFPTAVKLGPTRVRPA